MHAQDLAQDLPQDAIALELVLDRVREHDTTISDEQARTILVSHVITCFCQLLPISQAVVSSTCSEGGIKCLFLQSVRQILEVRKVPWPSLVACRCFQRLKCMIEVKEANPCIATWRRAKLGPNLRSNVTSLSALSVALILSSAT